MSGLHNIPKTIRSLKERGLSDDSFFRLVFADGSECTEHDTNWSAISEQRMVTIGGVKKMAMVCTLPVTRIEANHAGLRSFIDVPEGGEVYQSVQSTTLIRDNKYVSQHLGRILGIIKDGQVIEEHFLDGILNEVRGAKY
jgi:hypothetical protein